MRLALLIALLAAPASAQPGAPMMALSECFAATDVEAVAARMETFAVENDAEARIGALCAAGDRDGAAALADDLMAELSAADAEAARFITCLETAYGETHPCDE